MSSIYLLQFRGGGGARPKGGLSSYFKNVDKKLAHLILNEIMDHGPATKFPDIGEITDVICHAYWFQDF